MRKIQQAVHAAIANDRVQRVQVLAPEELFTALHEQPLPSPAATVVRGYKVTVNYDAARRDEQGDRKRRLAGAILESLRKMK